MQSPLGPQMPGAYGKRHRSGPPPGHCTTPTCLLAKQGPLGSLLKPLPSKHAVISATPAAAVGYLPGSAYEAGGFFASGSADAFQSDSQPGLEVPQCPYPGDFSGSAVPPLPTKRYQ